MIASSDSIAAHMPLIEQTSVHEVSPPKSMRASPTVITEPVTSTPPLPIASS